MWCPDIPDDSPDIPDGAMQNFRPLIMAAPPNPSDLAQAIAAMLTGRDERTALLREIVQQGQSAAA